MSNNPVTSTEERDSDQQADSRTDTDSASVDELAAQLELLTEENQRLRTEYRRARQTSYRRTALGMAAVGILAGLGGLVFPSSQAILFALGGTGLFAAVLTYYLTPEQFVAASVGERTYAAFATTGQELIDGLGLADTSVYFPTAEPTADGDRSIRLFVPQHQEYELPDASELATLFVVTDDERKRGVSVPPTGAGLFQEFESMVTDTADQLPELADQLADALVEGFELVESATPEVDGEGDGVTIAVSGSRFGAVDRFDHPVASFIAVGLARGMERPVTLEILASDDDRTDYLIHCSFTDDE
ncbi:hypothetical protein [Haladaptatus sp. NG-SE-30]